MNTIKPIPITKKETGFTILEVLIAIVIFSIGILSVAQMQVHALYADKTAFEQTEAAMWASNQAETIISLPYTDAQLSAGNYGPVFADAGNKYALTWVITDNGGTKSIQITVVWQKRGGPKRLVFDYVKASSI